jgi:hypothetical protein
VTVTTVPQLQYTAPVQTHHGAAVQEPDMVRMGNISQAQGDCSNTRD